MKNKRRIHINLIHSRRSYTVKELSELFSVTTKTIRIWIKDGMVCLNPLERKKLVLGSDAIIYLKSKRAKRKCKLGKFEFLCLRCRKGVSSDKENIDFIYTGIRMGKDTESIRIRGKCIICRNIIYRFTTSEYLEEYKNHYGIV